METRYDDVEFVFQGDFADSDSAEEGLALGTVLVRADGEMVLMLAESDDAPPFCEIGAKPVDGLFTGENRRKSPQIRAEWRMEGQRGAGTWAEQGESFGFSFLLP